MDTIALGRKAEKIIADLFKDAGFNVIPYGYEYTVPQLCNKSNLIKGEAAEFIRHQPDFIVVNEDNEAFFIEVKFRKEGLIKKEHLFPYPSAYVVFLTGNHIVGQSIRDIHLRGENFVYLNKLEPFKKIPTPLIMDYVKKVRRQLGDETLGGQFVEGVIKWVTGKTLNPTKKPYTANIEGRELTTDGWERMEYGTWPMWAVKKMKKYNKNMVYGKHYKYKIDGNAFFRMKR